MAAMTAAELLKCLNGIICIYKPSGTSHRFIKETLRATLCQELNSRETRPASPFIKLIETSPDKFAVSVRKSFADNVLVVGPRYQPQDFALHFANLHGKNTSGVTVLGINSGIVTAKKLNNMQMVSAYHIKAKLGEICDTLFPDSRVRGKASYDHVKKHVLDNVLASFQAAHLKQVYSQCGFHLDTQECYELAVKGLLRPVEKVIPMMYSMKCIEYEPPYFTLEIQSINATEKYFLVLIHDIGLKLKTLATCTGLRCIRYGSFTVNEALLIKHFKADDIIHNMNVCDKILGDNYSEFKDTLKSAEIKDR